MNIVARQQQLVDYNQVNPRLVTNVKRWLHGDSSVNLAIDMYTDDTDGSRHANGHSSPAYYVMRDEDATFDIAMREIRKRYENFLDMGVGGDEAVIKRGLAAARAVGAKNYLGFDAAAALAKRSAELADENGFYGQSFTCDIFDRIPLILPNSLIGVLGQTIGNVETYKNPVALKKRHIEIYKNYAEIVTNPDPSQKSEGGLIVGWDANMNKKEVVACYETDEMADLIRSCPARVVDTDKLDFHITADSATLGGGQDVIFVSLGLRARVDHKIPCDGEDIHIKADQFLVILNTDRESVPYMEDVALQSRWRPDGTWSASGRVHYQHYAIA